MEKDRKRKWEDRGNKTDKLRKLEKNTEERMKKRDERNINKNNEMNGGQRKTERMEGK